MMQHTEATTILFDAVAELGKLLGLSKSASLALALLYTSEQPLSLDDIAEQTRIAKSSLSVILKNLEQLGLTKGVDKPHDRRKYAQVSDNLPDAIAVLIARRLDNITTRQHHMMNTDSPEHSPLQERRFEQLQTIYKGLGQMAAFLHTSRADAWETLNTLLAVDEPTV